LAADIERIRDRRNPELQAISAQAACEAAQEHDQRQTCMAAPERLVQLLNRERRVRVQPAVAMLVRAARRRDKGCWLVELRHHAVDRRCLHSTASTLASGRMVRISKIEIIGKNLRNRNSSVRNRPIVPTNVDQSQNVGSYMPQDEVRKSRWRLVT